MNTTPPISDLSARHRFGRLPMTCLACLLAGSAALADSPSQATPAPTPLPGATAADRPDLLTLPPIIVTAEKQPENLQNVPISLSAFTAGQLDQAGFLDLNSAAYPCPNALVSDLSARKVAEPYLRGIGASPVNPGVTVFLDGIPQLNNQSANIEWLDLDRIEILRGPQGTLYGRNTIGGAVNIISASPSPHWTAAADATFGNYETYRTTVTASGPLIDDKLLLGLAAGYAQRDGYSTNRLTGHDLDDRQATFAKARLLFNPTDRTDIRYVLWAESDRDGDYALNDLFATRRDMHRTSRDFEGSTRRDLVGQSLQLHHRGQRLELTATTGLVLWETDDQTDLDYSAAPNMRRFNDEQMWQFTQEIRLGSPADRPMSLSDRWQLQWQGGLFFFAARQDQDALSQLPVFFSTQDTDAATQTVGLGLFGQVTAILDQRWHFTAGLRGDYEHVSADLTQTHTLSFPLPTTSVSRVDQSEDFSSLSPRFVLACHLDRQSMLYGSITRGYKAGGFNTNAPSGRESFDNETLWAYELGLKSQWLDDRLTFNAALFYLDWQNIQIAQFQNNNQFVANAADAASHGLEVELRARPCRGLELLAGAGHLETEFHGGSSLVPTLSGNPLNLFTTTAIDNNNLPYAPNYQAYLAAQLSHRFLDGLTLFARADLTAFGRFHYEAANLYHQDAYTLVNFRLGGRGQMAGLLWSAELWMNNAFDTDYVPLAFPAPDQLANPSGFVGEPGVPRTFGLTVRLLF